MQYTYFMLSLPEQRSTAWLSVFALTFVGNFISLVLSRSLLNLETDFKVNVVFFAIAGIVSFISILGYMGMIPWFVISVVGNAAGIASLLFYALTRSTNNWSDVTSIISYLFVTIAAFMVGALIQLSFYLAKVFRHS